MGLFSGIKSNYKKAEAAVVVQNLLEHQQKFGFFDYSPKDFATKVVNDVWSEKPDIFNGKFGQRPHKISVAALSLAYAVDLLNNDYSNKSAVTLALSNLLSEVEVNGNFYGLNSTELESSPLGKEIDQFMNNSSFA